MPNFHSTYRFCVLILINAHSQMLLLMFIFIVDSIASNESGTPTNSRISTKYLPKQNRFSFTIVMCFAPSRWINANESWIWHKKRERSLYPLVHLYIFIALFCLHMVIFISKKVFHLWCFFPPCFSPALSSSLFCMFVLYFWWWLSVRFGFILYVANVFYWLWFFLPLIVVVYLIRFRWFYLLTGFFFHFRLVILFFFSSNIGHGSALKATQTLQITFILYNAQRIHT